MKNGQTLPAFRQNLHILQCPVCKEKMSLYGTFLKCSEGHCFDLSKEGYVNFINHAVKSNYSKQLFRSRKNITNDGFFNSLSRMLSLEIIGVKELHSCLTILDAGCGEGTLFNQVISSVKGEFRLINALGIDIAKDGIKSACRQYPDILWIVANLAQLPIAGNSIDIIINLLAPANYKQFKRVLKPGGILIKIVPGQEYLRELRDLFLKRKSPKDCSELKVVSLFNEQFRYVEIRHIYEKIPVNEESALKLLYMTPLLWNINDFPEEKVQAIKDITLDLHVLIGRSA